MSEDLPSAGRTHVFAYGSNLDVERMIGRVPSAGVLGLSRLRGFELRFHKRGWQDGTGKANAHGTDELGALVHGVVYEIDERHLAELDVHETGYERRRLTFSVTGAAGVHEVEAWIYIALPDVIDDRLAPASWYRDHVVRGARAHGLPGELIAWLEAHPTSG